MPYPEDKIDKMMREYNRRQKPNDLGILAVLATFVVVAVISSAIAVMLVVATSNSACAEEIALHHWNPTTKGARASCRGAASRPNGGKPPRVRGTRTANRYRSESSARRRRSSGAFFA